MNDEHAENVEHEKHDEAREPGVFALLADGVCVQVRPARPADWQAVFDFADALGRASVYRRFFGYPSRPGKAIADAVCSPVPAAAAAVAVPADRAGPVRPPASSRPRGALLALLGDEVLGVAEWIRADDPREAEVAFEVADRMHGHGVATLLAEHLLDEAERAGLSRLTAITQAENRAMLDVFAALGIPVRRSLEYGTWSLSIDLDVDAARRVTLLDAVARRERSADEASLRHLFAPAAIAVCGDPRDPVTRTVLENLRAFPGRSAGHRVWLCGPDGDALSDEAEAPLAVITGAPALAAAAVRTRARHGARVVVVTATGFDADTGLALLRACRETGVRLLGPGSLGVLVPAAGLNASLAHDPPLAGPVGVAVQSGGVGLALLGHLARLGVGVSSFAAVGEKYDVSANDILMHWDGDGRTALGLLHLESFGNPRKFARTARRLSRRVALLAVDPGAGTSTGTGTGTGAGSARAALYAQAGIVVVESLGALVGAAAMLAGQPAPAGDRVVVIGNTHGMVTLAVQACAAAGLVVVRAVDVTPAADAPRVREAMERAAGSGECDALMVVLAPTVARTPADALSPGGTFGDVTVVAVLTQQAETLTLPASPSVSPPVPVPPLSPEDATLVSPVSPVSHLSPAPDRRIPRYNDATCAAAALAAGLATTRVRGRADDAAPVLARVDQNAARRVIESCLTANPHGSALRPAEREQVLDAFGIRSSRPGAFGDSRRIPRLIVTAWQDPVFGPVLTCVPDGQTTSTGALLVPAGQGELTALAMRALAAVQSPHISGDTPSDPPSDPPIDQSSDTPADLLADLLARADRMIDDFPRLAAVRLTIDVCLHSPDYPDHPDHPDHPDRCADPDHPGVAVHTTRSELRVSPAERVDPYLRRLRRAPVE